MYIPGYYEFVNPGKILSGKYALENISTEFRLLGSSRVMVLSDKVLEKLGQVQILSDALISGGVKVVEVYTDIPADSSIEVVNKIAELYRKANADSIVALGGGSVIDTAKGLRMLISQGGTDILKFVGAEVLPYAKHVPFAAVPTTSGTGSEATAVAVIKDNERKVKMEFISQFLLLNLSEYSFCKQTGEKIAFRYINAADKTHCLTDVTAKHEAVLGIGSCNTHLPR